MEIVKFDSLESTNKYCEVLNLAEVEDFTCYWALEQTAGIGQRGNHWHSTPGENLTFSLVLHPTWLPAERQFRLTEALSLALVDFLLPLSTPQSLCDSSPVSGEQPEGCHPALPLRQGESPKGYHPALPLGQGESPKGKGVKIKWPNDIYVDGKKICGTLITTRLSTQASNQSGNKAIISSAICGIGLNINETDFPDWLPNPTSLRLLTGQRYELEPLLQQLLQCIERRYDALRHGTDLEEEYLSLLLGRGVPAHYLYQGRTITATIDGVDPFGRLLLTASDGTHLCCNLKEIALLQQ